MTWAIQIGSGIQASRYDAETEVSELVRFPDGHTTLSTRFRVSQTREIIPIFVGAAEDDAGVGNDIVVFNVKDDGMSLEFTGDVEGFTIEDIILVICETVLATDAAAASDKAVVFLGAESPIFREAAVRAGFEEVDFLLSAEAAVRQWEHSRDVESTDVLVVTCNTEDGSTAWEARVADHHGFLVPDDGSNRGRFVPASPLDADTNLEGLTRFFDWAQQQQQGSRNVIFTGSGTRTEGVKEFISVLEAYGYDVFCADPLIGGALPPIEGKYQRCDDWVQVAVMSLREGFFDAAIDCFQEAEALFDPPPEDVEHLRASIVEAILSAAESEVFQEACTLCQLALSISRTDAEHAQIYVKLVDIHGQVGNLGEASEAGLSAAFFDPACEAQIWAKLAQYREGETQASEGSERGDAPGYHNKYPFGVGAVIADVGMYLFVKHLLPY